MLFERSPDAVYLYDFKGRFLDANDRYLHLFGYSREEMAGPRFADLWAEDYSRPAAALVDELKTTGRQSEPLIFRLRRKDGTSLEVETTAAAVQRGEGPPAALGIARDVTERLRSEEALRDSEERFRSLNAAAPVGIFLTDAQGETVYVNERMLAICGLTFEESMGLGWLRVVHPDDRERVAAAKEKANAENQEFAEDFRIITREGETRWVSARSTAMGDHGRAGRHAGGHNRSQAGGGRAAPERGAVPLSWRLRAHRHLPVRPYGQSDVRKRPLRRDCRLLVH